MPHLTGTNELTEIVTDRRSATRRWYVAMSSAQCELRLLGRPQFDGEQADPASAELAVLGRGIPVRVVYDDRAVHDRAAIARRQTEIAAGEQARIAGPAPVHMMLIDDRLALLPLGPDPSCDDGLLVVRRHILVDALSALFEALWANALPLHLGDGPERDGQPEALRNDTTRTILGLLSAGLIDQAVAHRLGCSERTVQRHVVKLTEAVGAKTRFQAGLALGRRNWTA